MKLEKFKDKSKTKRKVLLISLGVVVLISISFLIYKNYNFKENDDNVYFAFYKDNEPVKEMPQKDNEEGLVFDHGECDNGADIVWDNNEWAPLVKNLSKSKTKCSIYFGSKESFQLDKDIPLVESGDGLYKVEHNDLTELGQEWNKTEYRFGGSNPNNYIRFNDEIWRIIGLVNVQTEYGIEQRIKIIRKDNTEGQDNFGNYPFDLDLDILDEGSEDEYLDNNWTNATLMKILNGLYYNSESGSCFYDGYFEPATCDFKNGNVKGINDIARGMIDTDVIWNLGGINYENIDFSYDAKKCYIDERINESSFGYPLEWTKENSPEYHNGIGLAYISDFGYAFGGDKRDVCMSLPLTTTIDYWDGCLDDNWIIPPLDGNCYWTMVSQTNDMDYMYIFQYVNVSYIDSGFERTAVLSSVFVEPTLYLKPTVKIKLDSSDNYGSIENPFMILNE